MRRRAQRGNTVVETALFLPLLFLFLMGMVELGRITYIYFTLHKMLYTVARYVGTQQGVNFCNESDATVAAAKNLALTGTEDASTGPILANLTPDLVQVRIERYNAGTGQLDTCDCSATGCDVSTGGQAPDYLVVTVPDGYQVQLRIPYLTLSPIPLKPQIRVPYGGT